MLCFLLHILIRSLHRPCRGAHCSIFYIHTYIHITFNVEKPATEISSQQQPHLDAQASKKTTCCCTHHYCKKHMNNKNVKKRILRAQKQLQTTANILVCIRCMYSELILSERPEVPVRLAMRVRTQHKVQIRMYSTAS